MLEQPGNPKTAWLGSPGEAVDSCAPPISGQPVPMVEDRDPLTSKPITAVLITFQLAQISWDDGPGRTKEVMTGLVELLSLPRRDKHIPIQGHFLCLLPEQESLKKMA